ncbi:MAG: hypothetical protein WC121_13125 [Candidatus Kapaibacterium sp.]
MTKILLKVLFVVLSLYFIGCNEQPTELGYKIDSVTFTAISNRENNLITDGASQKYYLTPFNQGIFHVGKTGEYASYPILRYGELLNLVDAEIISATLHLINSDYAFGDTNALQSFEIYEVQEPILPSSTYETIFKANGVDAVYKDELMGSFEMVSKDIEDTTKIVLKTQLIKNWIAFSILDSGNTLDTNDIRRKYSYSIGLKPTANSNVINGFLSDRIGNSGDEAPNPYIQIVYKMKDSTTNDTMNLRSNIAAFYAEGPTPDIKSLTVQSGLSVRSMLNFDISTLPRYSSVVKAVLKVYVDDSRSMYGSKGKDSFLLAQKDLDFDSGFFLDNKNIYLGVRVAGTNYYRFSSVTSAVEDWVKTGEPGSLLLNYSPNGNPNDSYKRLDKYYLYGVEADSALRPELTIFYAKRPDFR